MLIFQIFKYVISFLMDFLFYVESRIFFLLFLCKYCHFYKPAFRNFLLSLIVFSFNVMFICTHKCIYIYMAVTPLKISGPSCFCLENSYPMPLEILLPHLHCFSLSKTPATPMLKFSP